ncbi:MAG: anaerobic ribonucleoside-triphosphate reductase, partial [Acutalibacteraceae bacterium]
MISKIRKRNGDVVDFQSEKITRAIFKAANAVGGNDWDRANDLTQQVVVMVDANFEGDVVDVEKIQDLVEKVLIENGHAKTAKAYILYREKRRGAREANALIGATIDMFSNYLGDNDWRVKENANAQKSINGMNNYIRETFTKQYWLHEVYPDEIRNAHQAGDLHLHDLGFFGPYCAGWDLKQLLIEGFGGVPGKVESS